MRQDIRRPGIEAQKKDLIFSAKTTWVTTSLDSQEAEGDHAWWFSFFSEEKK